MCILYCLLAVFNLRLKLCDLCYAIQSYLSILVALPYMVVFQCLHKKRKQNKNVLISFAELQHYACVFLSNETLIFAGQGNAIIYYLSVIVKMRYHSK